MARRLTLRDPDRCDPGPEHVLAERGKGDPERQGGGSAPAPRPVWRRGARIGGVDPAGRILSHQDTPAPKPIEAAGLPV